MTLKKRQNTIKALIRRGDGVLFVKDPKDVWELPGGRIIKGETPARALTRELKEELCFDNVKIGNIVHRFSFVSKVTPIEYDVTVYECFTDEDVILQTEEAKEYRWINFSGINNLNTRDGYKRALQQYFFVH
ncbi:MAG: NUDIX hydrolase [Candidatus Kerfeldbacteria bacterium]|nr:NUDIX hydrolase [Candidatus Kerfeldbacteria bacterium]